MAKISTISEAIMLCREANISLMIWGKHGVGKSSIVAEVATQNKMGCVNLRLSQMEASDIRGFPEVNEGYTVYRPSKELPVGDLKWEEAQKIITGCTPSKQGKMAIGIQSRLENGILFLDESFRAQDDVQQAIFELVLDRKVGQYVLPEGWSIVCANNFFEGYCTNNFMDPAFLDRFCHIILSDGPSTTQEWVDYMVNTHGDVSAEIVEFCAAAQENLDGVGSCELGFSITPSRRAWDMVGRVLKSYQSGNYSETTKNEVIAGLVGRDLAMTFSRYSCPIKPRDIIEKGVKALENKLLKLKRNQYVGLTWGLGSHFTSKMNDIKYINIALDFSEWMIKNTSEKDLVTGFLAGLVSSKDGINDTRRAALSNPKVAALIAKAEKKIGKSSTFLQELQKRKELSRLIANTTWGI